MKQHYKILQNCDISELEKQVFNQEGKLIIKPYAFWEKYSLDEIHNFTLTHAIYVIPTLELISFLKENILGNAIEIGAGNGSIGRALNIPITDSRMQERPDIRLMYLATSQPVIKYPEDVEKLDAIEAIHKYKPQTVI